MAEGIVTPVVVPSGALASSADLIAFGYPATAATQLVRASVRVRAYAKQDIAAGTSTVDTRFPFLLPQRPVTAITSVVVVSDDGSVATLGTTDYHLEGQKLICDGYRDQLLRITYAHGFATIPDELKEVVCAVANRLASAPAGLMSGIQSESADGESISYGSDAFGGVAELTSGEKRVIDRLFPHSHRVPSVAVTM